MGEQGVQPGQAASRPGQRAMEAPQRDALDEKLDLLEKLGQLRRAAILTEEEFKAQKAAILAR